MKNILFLILLAFISINAMGQSNIPQLVSFSALVRDANNQPLVNTPVSIRLTFKEGGQTGPLVYCALHQTTTNQNGFMSLQLNRDVLGTGCNGAPSTLFEDIPWENGGFWMEVEYQVTPGDPFENLGQLELASSFYAFAAGTAESISGMDLSGANDGDVLTYNITTGQWEPLPAPTNEPQQLSVSATGDTLYLENGGYVIIPGISTANYIYTPGDGVTDNSGNFYTSVIIGNQEWLGKNLRTTKYANGDPITFVPTICHNGEYPIKSYAYFEEDSSNTELHGLAYTGRATTDTRNVCPIGWHLPSQQEYEILISELGGISQAGTKMKMVGFGNGTNESGLAFTAVGESDLWTPGSAYCYPDYLYGLMFLGAPAYYWTSSAGGVEGGGQNALIFNGSGVQWYIGDDAGDFHGVRCVKD